MLFLLLPLIVASQKLTLEENLLLQKHCGVRGEPYEVFDHPILRIKENIRRRRSMVAHGNPANFYQAPWSASLGRCTATWISPRHLLTAAHCFYRYTRGRFTFCQIAGTHTDGKQFADIRLDCSKDDPFYDRCKSVVKYETSYRIVKAISSKKTFDCEGYYSADIILLEVEDHNDTYLQQYACLPENKLGPKTNAELYGYGNTAGTSNRMLNALNSTLQPDDTLRDQVNGYGINHDGCPGDSGAGYVYQEKDLIFLAAIFNGVRVPDTIPSALACGVLHEEKTQQGTAVYPHLDWICLYSGVCREIGVYEDVMRRKEEIEKTVEVVTF